MFLSLMRFLGNNQNVQFFRSSDGFKIVTDMMPYGTTRRLACGLLSLLLVSEGSEI